MNAPLDENNYQWQPAPPVGPQPGALRYLWNHPVVIAGVMGMLLLLVTAVSIIAIKAVDNDAAAEGPRNDGGQQGTNQPANPAPAGSGTGTPSVANQPPAAAGTAPAVNSTKAVYLSGKLTLQYYDSGVDFDTAKKSSLAEGEKYDFDIAGTGLTAVNRGQAGVGATGAPTPEGCVAATVKWGTSAHVSVLAPAALICVKTSDDRLGALTVAKLDKSDDGQLRTLEVDYVVWKKQGDQ